MEELVRRALMGDKKSQEECTEKGIMLPCTHCGGIGKVSFKDYRFIGKNYMGEKKIIYRVQIICNRCKSRGKPIFTNALINPNPYITKWGNSYHEQSDVCKKETETFYEYVKSAIFARNTRTAPPIRRCGECAHYRPSLKMCIPHGTCNEPDDFCSRFKPKERE